MTGRPWPLRFLPLRTRELLVHARYLRRAPSRPDLFRDAPLALAPAVRMDLAATDVGHAAIAFAGVYEARLSRVIWKLARRGGLLLDVGANYGYYSLLWAAARPDNRVLALEASPHNIAPLASNVRRNGFASRIEVRHAAAGRVSGTVTLDLGPPDQTGWGGIAAQGAERTAVVPAVTLDDLAGAAGMARVEVLKVDVEGADAWVLEGAERLLAERRVAHVFFEQNNSRMAALGITMTDTLRFLDGVGYRARPIGGQEWHATPGAA